MTHQPLTFLKSAHALAFEKCIPWYVTIELNQACNLKCTHCYNFDRSQNSLLPFKELNFEKVLEAINSFKKMGSLMIALSGGEPLMYKNLFKVIEHITKCNLAAKLKTNGTLINLQKAIELKKHGLKSADISLYGATSKSHEIITNQVSSFDKTIQGIKHLRSVDISVDINFIIHQHNYHEIDEMIQLANKLDCRYNFATEITVRYDHTHDSQNLEITADQLKEILLSKNKDLFHDFNKEPQFQCECARTVCAIGHQGNVYPCIGAPIISGNIFKDSLEDIWKESFEFKKIRNLKNSDFKECVNCNLNQYCSRSSGSAYVNTGNYTGKNPSHCKEAVVRHKTSLLRF